MGPWEKRRGPANHFCMLASLRFTLVKEEDKAYMACNFLHYKLTVTQNHASNSFLLDCG